MTASPMDWAKIDDWAKTSDDVAVRRRFNRQNLIWLSVLVGFFLFFSFVQVMNASFRRTMNPTTPEGIDRVARRGIRIPMAGSAFILCAATLAMSRGAYRARAGKDDRWARVGRWTETHIRGTVIFWVLLWYTLQVIFAGRHGWIGWSTTLPFILLGFRMAMAEILLLYGGLLVGGTTMALLYPKDIGEVLLVLGLTHGIGAAISIFLAHRAKTKIAADWSERRMQAQEQLRMRDELRYARDLQLSMLPESAPDLGWLDISSTSIPATEVGGDYYDYFVEGGQVAVVCGDVAGHGMASGLVLAGIRSGFTLLQKTLNNPASVLEQLHHLIGRTSNRRMLVTVSVLLLDEKTREATIANAGHPPILVRRADGSVESIELFAPPLGVRLPVAIPQTRRALASGDLFVLHSDGVYETRNEFEESYGMERLIDIVRRHGTASAQDLRDEIVADVEAFRGDAPQGDDVTVVVVKVQT